MGTQKNKPEIKMTEIYIELWDRAFMVVHGDTEINCLQAVEKKYGLPEAVHEPTGFKASVTVYTTGHWAVWFRTPVGLSVIQHECIHILSRMLHEGRGIALCSETDEVYAYTGEFIFKKVVEVLRNDKVKINYGM